MDCAILRVVVAISYCSPRVDPIIFCPRSFLATPEGTYTGRRHEYEGRESRAIPVLNTFLMDIKGDEHCDND
jgi:hypothetical protein